MDWQDFEESVFEECQRVYHNSEVIKDTHLDGIFSHRKRQIDVLVKNYRGKTLIVDAKHYKQKVDIKIVESFIGMLKDTGADFGQIISEKGFTKSAINRAHIGENNIEVDILCLNDLKTFQSPFAIPFAGENGIVINAPFGWIIDGKKNEHFVATLYQRGISFDEATISKEWAYISFWTKDKYINTIDKLISFQNSYLKEYDSKSTITITKEGIFVIRKFDSHHYPTSEFTIYQDFDNFILFVVLFCQDNIATRNIEKIKYMLSNAIPIHVKDITKANKTI